MLDKEIQRLLKLQNIPGFKLLPAEEECLEQWKKAQKPAKIRKSKARQKAEVEELEPNLSLESLKVTNEVKSEDKETSDPVLEG